MKKLVALLMALVLALSCTAAFAEEAAAATGTMTGLSVALDENYVKSLAGAMDPDGSLAMRRLPTRSCKCWITWASM